MRLQRQVDPAAFLFPMLVTLTLRPGPDVAALVALALKSFMVWKKAMHVKRYVRAVEVKPHALGWYVHIHALVDRAWLDHADAVAEWSRLTGAQVVDIRRVSKSSGGRAGAVREVLKYVTKDVDRLTPDLVDQLGAAARGRHLVAKSGCLSRLDTVGNKCATEARKGPSLPCPVCGSPLRLVGFVHIGDFQDGFDCPDYDFKVREATIRDGPLLEALA